MKYATTLRDILITLLLATSCHTVSGQWVSSPKFPGGQTDGITAFTIGNKMYTAGGLNAKTLYEYDPATNTWTILSNIGGGLDRAWSGSFVINNKAYLVGGSFGTLSDVTDDVQEYDPATDTWTAKAKYPGGNRDGMYTFTIGNKAYVGGGFDGAVTKSDFYEYDPTTDTWTQKATPPFGPVIFASAFTIGRKGYVTSGSPGGSNQIKTLYEYDPATDTWTRKADFPGAERQAGFSFSNDTEGFYGGGMSNYNTTYKDIWKYEPLGDKWTQVTDITYEYTAWAFATVVSGDIYVGTGARFTTTLEFTDEMYKYQLPASVSTVNDAAVQFSLYPNPAHNSITLSGDDIHSLVITDITGRTVMTMNDVTVNTIDISSLHAGSYIVQMATDKGRQSLRMVKQ